RTQSRVTSASAPRASSRIATTSRRRNSVETGPRWIGMSQLAPVTLRCTGRRALVVVAVYAVAVIGGIVLRPARLDGVAGALPPAPVPHEPAPPAPPPPPPQAPPADEDEPSVEPLEWIDAHGACERPDDSRRADLERRVLAWIDRAVPGERL